MICQICKSIVFKVHKVIKGTEIFECEKCSLGFLKNSNIFRRSGKNIAYLYNFVEYKKQEKKLRTWFGKLTDEVVKHKKLGRVLDVGAGYGLFSLVLRTKGDYSFDLIEPNSKIRFIDKSYFLYKTTFEKFTTEKKYDIIIMLDVLEHFKDPVSNLKKARELLKDDGLLVIQTPNYKSLMAWICKDWAWWMIEDHKFFFSPKSIQKILQKTGLKAEYLRTYEDWYDFKKNLDGNFTSLKNVVFRKFVKAIFFGLFFPAYLLLRNLIWKFNYGGLLFVITK